MKKAFSFILVSVMLLSTILMCNVQADAAEVEKKPFYYSNWDPVDSEEFPNLYDRPYFWAEVYSDDNIKVSWGGKSDIPGIAQVLKEEFDKFPDGSNMRIINITALERRIMSKRADDVIFFDKGAEFLANWMDEFLAEYKRIGGKLDGIGSDLEYFDGGYWYLYSNEFQKGNQEVYYNITQNESYQTRLRPMLEERGFQFYPKPLDTMPAGLKKIYCELYSVHPYSGDQYWPSRYIWNACINEMYTDYLNEVFYEPLMEYYPDAIMSDWETRDSYGWMKEVPELGGFEAYLGGNRKKAGNYSDYSVYNYAPVWVTPTESNTTYEKPISHNDAVYEINPYNVTLWEVNTFKNTYAATDTKKMYVWLTFFDYVLVTDKDCKEGNTNTPFHTETYLHAAMLDPEFGGYVIENEVGSTSEYEYRLQVIQETMDEINRVLGYADRKPIETPANWNDAFILSGMYVNGRNVWRVTPDTVTGASRKNVVTRTADGALVFKNKGQTITFPQGTIIEDGFISGAGSCGFWVETPADVMPTMTSDADRYSKYPAYSEIFDNYQTGMSFDPKNTQYTHTWESWILDGSSATIQESAANANDKVLEIKGNAFLNSVKLPEYITAGDYYAQQQAWEISFNLPELPSGDAQVKLLTASSGGTTTDGGFRIMGDKLYYGPADDYIPFENVTLAANTEYTVKRILHLTNAEALSSSYYVYDASGNLLDKAENIAMPSLKLPVQKVGISTENFDGKTLLLDDLKMYAVGLTTQLEIYDADTGIMVADPTAARDKDTAYRLSWMNASDVNRAFNVVATYNDGTKEILKTIVMKPGYDAVDTGIVKVDGKSVTITHEEIDAGNADINPGGQGGNNQGGNQGGNSQGGNQGGNGQSAGGVNLLLLTITVGVACICAIALVFVITMPQPKKSAAENEADAEATDE